MEPASRLPKLRRSLLYVPSDNVRALEKCASLDVDCVIFDLEDAVSAGKKAEARENVRAHFADHAFSQSERAIRINALDSEWGTEDLMCARACQPDAIVLPKVNGPDDILALADALDETDAAPTLEIFAMIETAKSVLNIADIAALGENYSARLSTFIVGLNDLIKETQIDPDTARLNAHPWLMQIILGARAGGLDVIDGVFNNFNDSDGLKIECANGVHMGFDGKSLIHPAQIDVANMAFSPSETALLEADRIVQTFRLSENATKGVIDIDGKMVERLHLAQAEALLTKAAMMRGRMKDFAASELPD